MRLRTIVSRLLPLALALPTAAYAQQQVSDADRLAARELYAQGDQLQQQGKFAEALDKFQRSYETFNAPTTALHIAECQAALLRLVEAAETYRSISRMQLDDKSPEAFRKARDQAIAELAQVEPRIPHLTIKVTPQSPPNLVVTVDGQPMNKALVGVARPIDPGVHKVTAVASGYLQAEQTIDVKERTSPTIALTLQPGGNVTYTPVSPNPSPNPTVGPQPPPTVQWQRGWTSSEWQPPPRQHSRMSLLIGGNLGGVFPSGDLAGGVGASDLVGPGFGGGGEVALRFGRFFTVGGMVGVAGLGSAGPNRFGWSFHVGPYLAYISHPEGVGFYGEIGGVYRALGGVTDTSDRTFTGGEFLVGIGVHVKAGNHLRIVPKAEMFAGVFTNDNKVPILNQTAHFVFNLGLTIFFDIDLDQVPAGPK